MGRGSADLDTSSPIGEWAGDDNGKGGQENTGTKEEVTGGGKRGKKQKEGNESMPYVPSSGSDWFSASTGKYG